MLLTSMSFGDKINYWKNIEANKLLSATPINIIKPKIETTVGVNKPETDVGVTKSNANLDKALDKATVKIVKTKNIIRNEPMPVKTDPIMSDQTDADLEREFAELLGK